jgi:hypothetical protein
MRYAYAPDELRPDSPLAAAGDAGAGVGVGLSIGGDTEVEQVVILRAQS